MTITANCHVANATPAAPISQYAQDRWCESLALVSILQSLAAAEIANALHLRDFQSPAIFEFFNTIRQEPTSKRLFDHLVGAAE